MLKMGLSFSLKVKKYCEEVWKGTSPVHSFLRICLQEERQRIYEQNQALQQRATAPAAIEADF